MAGAALRLARWRGHEAAETFTLVLMVLHVGLATHAVSRLSVLLVQAREGICTELSGVAIPALAAQPMAGTGRVSAGFGTVLTASGLDAAPSPLIAGGVACNALDPVAAATIVVWLVMPRVLDLRAGLPRREEAFAGDNRA